MTAADIQRASRILERLSPDTRVDQVLSTELSTTWKRISPAEKRSICEAVYAFFRWLQWLPERGSYYARLSHAVSLQERFNHDPLSVKKQALAALAIPSWLTEEVTLSPDDLRFWQTPPKLWIRCKQGMVNEVRKALPDCVSAATPESFHSIVGQCLHQSALQYKGVKDLFRQELFQKGCFEIQDLGSQLVGHACAAQPGETWWDTCAGEGGKTLHLADLMRGKGMVWATDRHTGRLETLRERTARAEVFNYRSSEWDGSPDLPTKTLFDGILVDAPCSGVGTWQRNPQARWTTTQKDVLELAEVQKNLLRNASKALKPGGRLIFAVCTITRSETQGIVDSFNAEQPDFQPSPLFHHQSGITQLLVQPHVWQSNGMFIAGWTKKA